MPISPNQGSSTGKTIVTITGVNLADVIAVNFSNEIANIQTNTPNSITVTSPEGSGIVYVYVTTPVGVSNYLPFYYIKIPIINSIDPISGPIAGGNLVTINGSNLLTASSVAFGSNNATPTIINDDQISVIAPGGAYMGTVYLNVTTKGGTSISSEYTYVDVPNLTTIVPSNGTVNGKTIVLLNGNGLASTISVNFGEIAASFKIINNNQLSVITPAKTTGPVDVTIITTGGTSTLTNGYTYITGPAI